MKYLLTNKKGVTLLEGLIALLLLAVVSVGTFGVLLSVSRQAPQPTVQEEMLFAVERANNLLQIYAAELAMDGSNLNPSVSEEPLVKNLKSYFGTTPFSSGLHNGTNLKKLLPVLCDKENSSFTYTVHTDGSDEFINVATAMEWPDDFEEDYNGRGGWDDDMNGPYYKPTDGVNINFVKRIDFNITCNGYSL